MSTTFNTVTLWVAIVSASSALVGLHYQIQGTHDAEVATREADQKAQLERTAQAQKDWGLLMHRLANDEAAVAFLETQMPKDKRDILQAISQAQQQAQALEQLAPLRTTKSMRKKPSYDLPEANAPRIERPTTTTAHPKEEK